MKFGFASICRFPGIRRKERQSATSDSLVMPMLYSGSGYYTVVSEACLIRGVLVVASPPDLGGKVLLCRLREAFATETNATRTPHCWAQPDLCPCTNTTMSLFVPREPFRHAAKLKILAISGERARCCRPTNMFGHDTARR